MVRTVVTPTDHTISFDIPEEYIGKQIEVIAFSTDEEIGKNKAIKKEVSFNAVVLDTRNYKFNRDEANER